MNINIFDDKDKNEVKLTGNDYVLESNGNNCDENQIVTECTVRVLGDEISDDEIKNKVNPCDKKEVLIEQERSKCNNDEVTKNVVRKKVIDVSTVRTGFLGFIICLKNFYSLSEILIKNKICDYVLSYKLSQDHVEMFFALIRGMNGFSNNPTAIQFKSAFKKLLLNSMDVLVSRSANCTPQDDSLLISDTTDINKMKTSSENNEIKENSKNETKEIKKKRVRTKKEQNICKFKIDDCFHINYNIEDLSISQSWLHSEYLDDIIKHTAGFVIRSVKTKIHCKKCLEMLDGPTSSKSKLTMLKNRGGLIFVSDDVNLICRCTEKVIRGFKNSMFTQYVNKKLVTESLKIIPPSVLDDDNHSSDQEFLNDHRHKLIYLIVQSYIDTRLKHESDKLGDIKFRTRMHNNKMTIFKGE